MWTILFKTGWRDLLRRPWQTVLMILGVALGVAVVVAIDLANTSAARAFNLSTEAVVGRATHQIVGGPTGLDESVYRDLRVTGAPPGVLAAAPVVAGYARVAALGDQTVRVLGVDPFAEAPFRSYLTGIGTLTPSALAELFVRPGAVLLPAQTAEAYGVKPGDTFTLTVGSVTRTAVVVGILRPADDTTRRALDGLLLCDIATAQELLGQVGRLTRIDLIVANETAAQAVAARLPTGLRLAPASEQGDTVTQLTAAFRLNLTALSLLALVVGMFLIYNTVMFSVVQRRAMLGILRCLGVTGEQIFVLIVLEAAVTGALGGLLGLGLGIVLGRAALGLVTQTINDLYFVVSVRDVDVQILSVLKGLGLGIGAAVLAALAPAAEAATVAPVTTLSRSDLEQRVRGFLPVLTVVGASLIALGVLMIVAGGDALLFAFGGLFTGVLGVTLCTPWLTVQIMRVAAVLLRPFGLLGRMAARTVVNALSRTSVAIAALLVAVAVTIGVTVMITSFRTTVVNWLDLTLRADIYISSTDQSAGQVLNLARTVPERVRAVPGVEGIELIRAVTIVAPELGQSVRVNAVSRGGRVRSPELFRAVEGDPAQVWNLVAQGGVLVTEPFAYRHKVPEHGGRVTLLTDQGPHTFPVVGIYYDYSSDQGSVLMDLEVYRGYWHDEDITGIAVQVEAGRDVNVVGTAVRAALAGEAVLVQVNRALRDSALVVFDRTFAITAALRLLAVVVAFIGVLSALMALMLERTRELATLRALGLTRRELWQLTLMETGLMGTAAGVLSLPTGLALSVVLVYVINLRSFGWTITLTTTPEVYVQALAVSIVAAMLAAVYPAVRIGRMAIATGLRSE